MKQSQCIALHSYISHKSLDVALDDVVETYKQEINNVEAERTDQCAKCWRDPLQTNSENNMYIFT